MLLNLNLSRLNAIIFTNCKTMRQGRNKAMKVIKSMLEERRGCACASASPKGQDQKDFIDIIVDEMVKADTILSEQTALDLLFALPFAAFESASSAIILALKYLRNNPLALAELTVRTLIWCLCICSLSLN